LAAFMLCQAADDSLRAGRTVKLKHWERDGQVSYEVAG
jgi:hypothetical protein